MHWRLGLATALACVSFALAAEPAAVERARARVSNLRELVAAGAAAPKQLEQAELALTQAKDDAVIDETVYGQLGPEDLTEEQAAEMKAAAQRRVLREQAKLGEAAKLVSAGVAPRSSLLPFEDDLNRARSTVSAAEDRARLIEELAAQIRAEEQAALAEPELGPLQGPMPVVTRFVGGMKFADADLKKVVLAYQKQFDKKLPISARGQTALHRTLGFDHRGRVDVALNPDDSEGRWLITYLEKAEIPYFAFRASIRGQATAPHIHLGPPSLRLRTLD